MFEKQPFHCNVFEKQTFHCNVLKTRHFIVIVEKHTFDLDILWASTWLGAAFLPAPHSHVSCCTSSALSLDHDFFGWLGFKSQVSDLTAAQSDLKSCQATSWHAHTLRFTERNWHPVGTETGATWKLLGQPHFALLLARQARSSQLTQGKSQPWKSNILSLICCPFFCSLPRVNLSPESQISYL